MRPSRGMGAIKPSKMPAGKKKARRDDTDFTQYAEGGKVKSKVNEAGNYTKPGKRKALFESIKNSAVQGTKAGPIPNTPLLAMSFRPIRLSYLLFYPAQRSHQRV